MEEITGYPCPNCGYDPAKCPSQSFVLRPGTILRGKYVIGAVLGQGGFGITYIGWDLALERKVAVKEYYPMGQVSRNAANSNTLEWNTSEQARLAQGGGMDYFLKEGRKMARVADIPQVVNVLDIFQENETAYIIMNYSQGQTLKTYLKRNGPLGWAEAETIFLPVVNAMEQVHKAGLIHRDLSPDNLMLLPDGSVKILDLGAAKDLNINTGASSMQVAKHGFSPLEQYLQRGGSGPWSDVYALAATMYYSLAGVLPLPSVDRLAEDTLRWDLPQLAALPENVLTALQRAMAISPKARTQSMAEFASQLTAPVTVQPQQPERKVEPDRDKGTEAKAVENKKPEAAPESKKEPAPKGKEVPEDTAASKERKHSDRSSGKARKRLPVIAAVLALLVVAGGIIVWVSGSAVSSGENSANVEIPGPSGETVSAGVFHAVGLKADGTVVATGTNKYGQCDVSGWTDIVAISAGTYHTVGLKTDGTVVAVGSNASGLCNISGWKKIIAVSAGGSHTVGLKADGTVVATGWNTCGQCDVSGWTDIVAISAGRSHTVGLKADGTVVAVGEDTNGQCDVSGWTDIVAISAGIYHTVGLKTDGTVVAVGDNANGQCDVSGWADIVAISAGGYYTVGLNADGTVVATGTNEYGQCDVSSWTDIVAISTGSSHTVGLKTDGTVVAVGSNGSGQCDDSDWKDIKLPKSYTSVKPEEVDETSAEKYAAAEALAQNGETARAAMAFYALGDYQDARERSFTLWDTVAVRDTISAGGYHTVALKTDGTVVAVGENAYGQCNVSGWTDIVAISAGTYHTAGLKTDGTVVAVGSNARGPSNISGWKKIIAVSAGGSHTVGLKADGTVVATGWNTCGQCDVSGWTDIVAISAGRSHTVGLKADGTVVAVGEDTNGQCDVSGWTDIVAISAGIYHTVGLKTDGTVVAVGDNANGQCDVSGWADIVAISAGGYYTVGLNADGTVVATGTNEYGQCDVSSWTDIVAISAGLSHTVGLKKDGTLVAAGASWRYACNVSDWKGIRLP